MKILFVILGFCLLNGTLLAKENLGLIPIPQSVKVTGGTLSLNKNSSVSFSKGIAPEFKKMVQVMLQKATGFKIPIHKEGEIRFNLKPKSMPTEAYNLRVTRKGVMITASTQAGLFYGFQTFRQLLPPAAFSNKPVESISWQLPTVLITDEPLFSWRGILVDVSRTFQEKETILKFIDAMAACKLNVLHLHLTDHQGWRVEIKKYPNLTKMSNKFYTQNDIRDIVKYAQLRAIMVVPEIDVPGHSGASCRAYNQLCCKDKSGNKLKRAGTYCAGDEYSYQFLTDVLTEVAGLFPSPYVHLGADEVGTGNWKSCSDCQALMKKEGIKSYHGLEAYFVKRMMKILTKLGKKTITWDEAFSEHSEKNQVIMSWRGVGPGMKAAEAGHKVIFTPVSALYFDRRNSRSKIEDAGYSINTVNLNLPYFFTPANPLLSEQAQQNVLGAQGCIWGEKIRNSTRLFTKGVLRGCALAEATWSGPKKRHWKSFVARLKFQRKRLDVMDIPYYWEEDFTPKEVAILPPGTISKANGVVEVDVTKFITKSGMSEFMFSRYSGTGTYTVTQAILLKDGKEISKDPQTGSHEYTVTIDQRRPSQFYMLWHTKYDKLAKYTLRFKAKIVGADKFTATVLVIPAAKKDQYGQSTGPTSKANGLNYLPPDMK